VEEESSVVEETEVEETEVEDNRVVEETEVEDTEVCAREDVVEVLTIIFAISSDSTEGPDPSLKFIQMFPAKRVPKLAPFK